jgi:zona occludens toxin (predicted ATPase)
MMGKKKLAIIALAVVVVLAAFAYWATYAPQPAAAPAYGTPPNASQNSSAENLVDSSQLSSFNGTALSSAIANTTLNGSVTQDQNYSVLSTGNLIQSP